MSGTPVLYLWGNGAAPFALPNTPTQPSSYSPRLSRPFLPHPHHHKP